MTHTCGYRIVQGRAGEHSVFHGDGPNKDSYLNDDTCTFCGSLNPETFMKRLEAGDIEVGPTDKNYKVYVRNAGGEGFKQTFRDCYEKDEQGQMVFVISPQGNREAKKKSPPCTGPDDCQHWVTRDTSQTKFYFYHLSDEQQARFVELLNAKKMKIGYPGHFYRLPYFCKVIG